MEIVFWGSFAVILYTYAIYPIIIWIIARIRRRQIDLGDPRKRSISIVATAFNEEGSVDRRLSELCSLLNKSGCRGEIIVVSDGSSDNTANIARRFSSQQVRLIELAANLGKAAALTLGCRAARNEIIVFADFRQSWGTHTLDRLLGDFSDVKIGAVSGDLVVDTSPGAIAGVGLYWRFEKWLRRQESLVHSCVGVSGSICAVRRELFRAIPPGTVLDDVYWPLHVVMQGYRVVHDERAKAFDRLPHRVGDEFRRKVRTQSGVFQLLMRLPEALLPNRNPIWFQYLSHKILRLFVPWAMLAMLVSSASLPGMIYHTLFWLQIAFYMGGAAGVREEIGSRLRPLGWASSFLVLNAAVWVAFWVWILGKTEKSWRKIAYNTLITSMDGLVEKWKL